MNYSRKERLQKWNRSTKKQVFITSWKCCYCKYLTVSVISSTGKLRQIFATGKHSYDRNQDGLGTQLQDLVYKLLWLPNIYEKVQKSPETHYTFICPQHQVFILLKISQVHIALQSC